MLGDIWTIIWRDVRLYRAQFDDPRKFIAGIVVSTIFLIGLEASVGIHRHLTDSHPFLLIWIWCWLPLGSAVTLSTDAIAGERERHTLESLLSTRIPTRALLIGKCLAISAQSWLSAIGLAIGVLLAINLVTIWSGTIILYPLSVFLAGPLVSFLVTFLGTLTAILLSMDAPTVRQANFRILFVTSLLPVLLVVPLATLFIIAFVAVAVVGEFTGWGFPQIGFPLSRLVIAVGIAVATAGILLVVATTYAITAIRFTRERLLRSAGSKPVDADDSSIARTDYQNPRYVVDPPGDGEFSPASRRPWSSGLETGGKWTTIARDAGIVAWKELVEARGLVREWRGWLVIVVLVLASMIIQLSAIASWYWSQDTDTSILFWLAMAAAMPILIAQRSADTIAGERERHTGEALFTTRLNHTGILIGKLGVSALMPWTMTLSIPLIGLIATNLIHSSSGPYWYPVDVLSAGVGLTLGLAVLLASGGLLVSIGAPTVQHAARRISWFLMPMLIAPGLLVRRTSWSGSSNQSGDLDASGFLGLAASGELATYTLVLLPVLALACAVLIVLLVNRFQRGTVVFD